MEVHRIVLTVIDFDGLGVDDVCDTIVNARYPNDCIAPKVEKSETRDIGEWSDDHPLNKTSTAAAEMLRLFGA